MSRRLTPARVLIASAAALLLGVQLLSAPTLSGWTSGQIKNDTNTVKTGTGSQSFTHTYTNPSPQTICGASGTTANQSCDKTVLPLTVPTGTTATTLVDAIKNNTANANVNTTLSVPSCGPVKLSNQKGSDSNPMLPRYGGWTYGLGGPKTGMGAVTLGAPNAYATSLRARPWVKPAAPSGYAIGIWFKVANTGKMQPLMSLSTAAVGVPSQSDVIGLMVDTGGQVRAQINKIGQSAQSSSAVTYNVWHFAYAQYSQAAVTLWIDGVQSGSQAIDASYPYDAGDSNRFWRLGTANGTATGISSDTLLTGSVSNAVVYQGSSLPAAPTVAQLASQTSFDAWAAPFTEHWRLDDPGTTIHTGTKPDWLDSAPCAQVNLGWTTASPTGTSPARTLAAWTTSASLPGPAASGSMTSTLALSRITSPAFDGDAAGLWLLPTIQMTHSTGGGWGQTFTWSSNPASARILIQ